MRSFSICTLHQVWLWWSN